MRLDVFLADQYPNYSRSQLQQLIKRGRVSVNGKIVAKRSFEVTGQDDIIFKPPVKPDYRSDIDNFSKQVIYEDDNVIVINKPVDMLVHAKGGIDPEFTVQDFVLNSFNQTEKEQHIDNNRLGIVHRLDRATSGVMICAKNLKTSSFLAKQFADRTTKKIYLAITERIPPENKARLDLPIGRNVSSPATFKVDGRGKKAITDYQIIATNLVDKTALVELRPLTGRTHQLRVHLSYIGCPIIGDPIYNKINKIKLGRLMLHAYKLEITIPGPTSNQRKVFTALPPKLFNYSDDNDN